MKVTHLFCVAALFGAFVAAPALQAEPKADKPAVAAGEKPNKSNKPAVARVAMLRGELLSVNVESGELKIRAGKKDDAKEVVVQTNKETQVKIDGAAATLADLKPGMMIKVTPETGVATQIIAMSAKVHDTKPKEGKAHDRKPAEKPAK